MSCSPPVARPARLPMMVKVRLHIITYTSRTLTVMANASRHTAARWMCLNAVNSMQPEQVLFLTVMANAPVCYSGHMFLDSSKFIFAKPLSLLVVQSAGELDTSAVTQFLSTGPGGPATRRNDAHWYRKPEQHLLTDQNGVYIEFTVLHRNAPGSSLVRVAGHRPCAICYDAIALQTLQARQHCSVSAALLLYARNTFLLNQKAAICQPPNLHALGWPPIVTGQ